MVLQWTFSRPEPLLANPVAFTIDAKGVMYVAETYRYRTSVLDIRHYMFMLEDDLANRSTEDWIAAIKKNFPNDWQTAGGRDGSRPPRRGRRRRREGRQIQRLCGRDDDTRGRDQLRRAGARWERLVHEYSESVEVQRADGGGEGGEAGSAEHGLRRALFLHRARSARAGARAGRAAVFLARRPRRACGDKGGQDARVSR